jgi:hypothetical protein
MSAQTMPLHAAIDLLNKQAKLLADLEPGPGGWARVETLRSNLLDRIRLSPPAGGVTPEMQTTRAGLIGDALDLFDEQIEPLGAVGEHICQVLGRVVIYVYTVDEHIPLPAAHPLGESLPESHVVAFANELLELAGFEQRVCMRSPPGLLLVHQAPQGG